MNHYKFISLDEVYDILITKKKSVSKFVSFTFDDGYADTFIYAYPILKKYNIPFAVNLTTGIPDRTTIFWWYLLEELLSKHDDINFEIDNKAYYFKCKTKLDKYIAFRKMRGIILRSYKDDYMMNLRKIFNSYEIDLYKPTEEIGIDWDQIKTMSKDPTVTIGSHSVSHPAFNKISEEEISKEIVASVMRIEEQLGKKVEHFCYPFGRGENGLREFANVFPEHCDHMCCLPRVYKVGNLPKAKHLPVLASGALSALTYKFKRIVTE
jgi:peptidoglycan/xylan/chitin deacetylase (PgdA/CDA1 family)